MSYLVRVLLPDVPGSLGALADALGSVNASIQSVDIVESFPDQTVIDDLVIDLPTGGMIDSVITAAASIDGVEIDSIRPFSGRVSRRGQIGKLADLARTHDETQAKRSEAMAEFVNSLPQVMTASWAILLEERDGSLHRVTASGAAPEDDGNNPESAEITSARAINPESESWVPESWALLDSSLTAAPLGKTNLLLVLGRTGGPSFLASEVSHLGNLAEIAGRLVA